MRKVRDPATNKITINPAPDKHSATVVLMHGLGDTASGWETTAEMLADQMPHVKFILPTAPTRPITLNMGMSMPGWYDIKTLGSGDANADASNDKLHDPCDGIDSSRETVHSILEAENAEAGVPWDRMILAGFSQGGALALYTGLQLPVERRLAGLVVMSGYVANHTNVRVTQGLQDLPILHCHGKDDPLVRYDYAALGKQMLAKQGISSSYVLKSYDRLEHSINNDVLRDVWAFLQQRLPAGPEHVGRMMPPPPKPFAEMSVKELKAAVAEAAGGSLRAQAVGFSEKREFVELLEKHYGGPTVKG